jgi:hypothetical protein
MPWNINDRTLSPTYVDAPRERLSNFYAVDTMSGTIVEAQHVSLVHRDCFPEGDEELSDSETIALANRVGIPLDDSIVN